MLAHTLHRASQEISRTFAEKMNGNAITVTQFLVLTALDKRGRPTIQAKLVDITEVDRSTLSEMLVRLAHRGLVQRTPLKSDLRAVQVSITPQGKRVLTKARRAMTKAEEAFFETRAANELVVAFL